MFKCVAIHDANYINLSSTYTHTTYTIGIHREKNNFKRY